MMRIRRANKLLYIVTGVFAVMCVLLYMRVAWRESLPTELLTEVSVVHDKGMQGLQMDWLKQVLQNPQPEAELVRRQPGRALFRPTNHSSVHPSKSFRVSDVYDQLKFDNKPGGVWKQGFPIDCPLADVAANPVEVFIVPHSHHDAGWVKTYDDYFKTKTKPCLDSTLRTLRTHPSARFTYAEVCYFRSWFEGLSAEEKQEVHRLLHHRRLEIASGGWVMADEGTTHYHAVLDQLVEGHHWLMHTFGFFPNTSWAIDPFGHSTTMAYLVHKMHLSGHVINRIHYEVKRYLARERSVEFNWRQPWDTDGHTRIATHMLPFYAYDVPHTCGPDPSVCCQFDFIRIHSLFCPWKIPPKPITRANVAERAQLLADQYCKKSTIFRNQHPPLLVPLGDDFRFTSLSEWRLQVNNYNLLIDYWNAHPELGIKARFAVLSEYFDALHQSLWQQADQLPDLSGDLIVYADRDHDYWTGYFTSRPVDKALARQLESELRAADLLYVYAVRLTERSNQGILLKPGLAAVNELLTSARQTLGLLHHHDAITGTAKPFVVDDYALRRDVAFAQLRMASRVCLANLLLTSGPVNAAFPRSLEQFKTKLLRLRFDDLSSTQLSELKSLESNTVWNQTFSSVDVIDLDPTDIGPRFVFLFNPLAHRRTTTTSIIVRTPADRDIAVSLHDVQAVTDVPLIAQRLALPSVGSGVARLHVGPITMEPMSFVALKIVSTANKPESPVVVGWDSGPSSIVLRSKTIELHFNRSTGFLEQFVDLRSGLRVDVHVDFIQYRSAVGESHSGAYLFVPNTTAEQLSASIVIRKEHIRGPLFEQVTVYTALVNHTVRLYTDDRPLALSVEIENTVNLSALSDLELVMRIRTNIATTWPRFYTDSNCFQIMERSFHTKIPLQGNLYPMACTAFIEGPLSGSRQSASSQPHVRLTLLTPYTLGVTSMRPGEFAVWLDRRAPLDDSRGLFAALVGTWSIASVFRLFVEAIAATPANTVPQLTLQAHTSLMDLLQPVQRYLVDSTLADAVIVLPQLMPNFQLPCDYDLVSLRALPRHSPHATMRSGSSELPAHFGLWLHRLPAFANSDNSIPSTESQNSCNLLQGDQHPIRLNKMFSVLGLSKAAKTRRVTLVPEPGESLDWLDAVSVAPMELDGFLVM